MDGTGTDACVLVTGMHRSGTSATARCVNLLGVPFLSTAQIMDPTEFNPRGFWEDADVVGLNERYLRTIGSDHMIPTVPPVTEWPTGSPDLRAEALRLIGGATSTRWMVKDPRFMTLLQPWIELLCRQHHSPVVVLAVRNPVEVALSIEARDGYPRDLVLAGWLRSHRDLFGVIGDAPTFVCSFERLLRDAHAVADEMGSFLRAHGLPGAHDPSARAVLGEFIDSGLRHHQADQIADGDELKDDAMGVFRELERCHGHLPPGRAPTIELPTWATACLDVAGPLLRNVQSAETDRDLIAAEARGQRARIESYVSGWAPMGTRRRALVHVVARMAKHLAR